MTKISKSPERYTFQQKKYLERQAADGKTPENDKETQAMVDYYNQMLINQNNKELDPDWTQNNMEYDLRTTDWVLEKVRNSEVYAQNLYAAMCNNEFQKIAVEDTPENIVLVLKDGLTTWSCSWRYAGGIIADMQEEGDYINWYCSGINKQYTDDELEDMTEEQRDRAMVVAKFVAESVVTDEISTDLLRLGWQVILDNDNII